MLQIHNSLTQQKEIFKPITPGKVGIYVCGVTVYDYCHIGHARTYVVFDTIIRYLRAQGYDVKHVRNITDIDDKIIRRAAENNEDYTALTEKFIAAMHDDFQRLGIEKPDVEPRATEFLPQIIAMIQTLIDKKYAYLADNGDVYYKVSEFKNYGELAHQDLEKLRSGIRVDIVDAKEDPLDFVLWKKAKPNEPSWDSRWGKGRPGWHIECSAMSTQELGAHFDIHGGGLDLTFPHHQNEIAQSEASTGEKFVNLWVHGGFVQVDKEKMSKSLGNFFTIREVLAKFDPEVVRYFLIASHYRSPINYSLDNLNSAKFALQRFYMALRDVPEGLVNESASEFQKRFFAAMDDDFNTPEALAVLFDLVREINRLKTEGNLQQASEFAACLKLLGKNLGILQSDPLKFLHGDLDRAKIKEIEELILARNNARKNKDWKESDRIRDDLLNRGILLEDTPEGTLWRSKPIE